MRSAPSTPDEGIIKRSTCIRMLPPCSASAARSRAALVTMPGGLEHTRCAYIGGDADIFKDQSNSKKVRLVAEPDPQRVQIEMGLRDDCGTQSVAQQNDVGSFVRTNFGGDCLG